MLGCYDAISARPIYTLCQNQEGRRGMSRTYETVKVEQEMMGLFPQDRWTMLAHLLIFHGRRVCEAKVPRCCSCMDMVSRATCGRRSRRR